MNYSSVVTGKTFKKGIPAQAFWKNMWRQMVATLVNFLQGGMSPSAFSVLQDSHRCNGKTEHDIQGRVAFILFSDYECW